MLTTVHCLAMIAGFAPLLGGLIAGFYGKKIGRTAAHLVTIAGIGIAFISSLYLYFLFVVFHIPACNIRLYEWAMIGDFKFTMGFLLDRLTVIMLITVTFVSLLVHIYSIEYMHEDKGYQRFFSYMSLFTFFMLMLVMANNCIMLFFGWEGVGLVSYLLIGFWFHKESAASGSLKAFIVNRVSDFGFILGLAAILAYMGSLDYQTIFAMAPKLATTNIAIFPGVHAPVITVICLLLFVGAMGKSAQVPLHIWLPESMEGPTPISALIHAATMVTAGVYMIARFAPLYDLAPTALSVVLIVGATGALFMGLLGLVENDIKRVIAYSTMSQLGYMMAANGVGAYPLAIFHLTTHACFKALLFLAAGSIILTLHHEQDLRKMGNLRHYLPYTYAIFLIGALALSAIPPFSGFYSKDAIIEAVKVAAIPGASYAYICLLIGAFITALYIFRAFFLAFHTKERMSHELKAHIEEPSWIVALPLLALAILAIVLGMAAMGPMLSSFKIEHQDALAMALDAYRHPGLWLSLAGIITAWLFYVRFPQLPIKVSHYFSLIYNILRQKYGFDAFNDLVIVRGSRALSNFLFNFADVKVIDDMVVNGSGRGVNIIAGLLRKLQSGYLYHYAFAMILGLLVFIAWLLL